MGIWFSKILNILEKQKSLTKTIKIKKSNFGGIRDRKLKSSNFVTKFSDWNSELLGKPAIITDLVIKNFWEVVGAACSPVWSSLVWETSTRDAIKLAGFVTVLGSSRAEGYWTCIASPCTTPSILGELTRRDVYPVYKVSARNSARPVPRIFREKTFDWFSRLFFVEDVTSAFSVCPLRHEYRENSLNGEKINICLNDNFLFFI